MTIPISARCSRSLLATFLVTTVAALAGCGGKPANQASQVVATVNKSEISVHQINHVLQRQSSLQPAQAEAAGRQVLERLVEQEIAIQKALDMKLDRDPAVMQSLAAARRDVLARAYAGKIAESVTQPEAADVQAYFAARPNLFASRKIYALQEFAVQADVAQTDALRQFVTGAKNLTEVTNYLRDQKLGVRANQSTQPAENLPSALLEKLAVMKDGQLLMLSAPGGARIVVMAGSRPAPVTLDQARTSIMQAILAERRRDAVQASLSNARKESEVQYFGAFANAASAAASTAAAPQAAAVATPLATGSIVPEAAQAAASAAADADMVGKGLAGLK